MLPVNHRKIGSSFQKQSQKGMEMPMFIIALFRIVTIQNSLGINQQINGERNDDIHIYIQPVHVDWKGNQCLRRKVCPLQRYI